MRKDGFFTGNRAMLRVKVTGAARSAHLNLAIDTCADPAVILSEAWATHLDLMPEAAGDATLADGSKAKTQEGLAEIEWAGGSQLLYITIFPGTETGVGPNLDGLPQRGGQPNGLAGHELLAQGRLTIDYINQTVSLEAASEKGA